MTHEVIVTLADWGNAIDRAIARLSDLERRMRSCNASAPFELQPVLPWTEGWTREISEIRDELLKAAQAGGKR